MWRFGRQCHFHRSPKASATPSLRRFKPSISLLPPRRVIKAPRRPRFASRLLPSGRPVPVSRADRDAVGMSDGGGRGVFESSNYCGLRVPSGDPGVQSGSLCARSMEIYQNIWTSMESCRIFLLHALASDGRRPNKQEDQNRSYSAKVASLVGTKP